MSTIVVTESQYNRLLVDSIRDSFKKIIVNESQYYRLIDTSPPIVEQIGVTPSTVIPIHNPDAVGAGPKSKDEPSLFNPKNYATQYIIKTSRPADMTTGWATWNGKENGRWQWGFDGEPVHISYFCGNYVKDGELNMEDSFGKYNSEYAREMYDLMKGPVDKKFPNEKMGKWINTIWKLGLSTKGQSQGARSKNKYYNDFGNRRDLLGGNMVIADGLKQYIQMIKQGDVKFKSTDFTGGVTHHDKDSAYVQNYITVLNKFRDVASNYPQAGTCDTIVWETTREVYKNSFFKWLATWTTKDWIDALAIVTLVLAFIFPPINICHLCFREY